MRRYKIFLQLWTLFLLTHGISLIAQKHSFVPSQLRLITSEELNRREIPAPTIEVYYADGSPTSFETVLTDILDKKLIPYMYVDETNAYKVLVVEPKKEKVIEITYESIPAKLKNLGYSFGNPTSEIVVINTQGGPLPTLLVEDFEDVFIKNFELNPEDYFLINVHQRHTQFPEELNKEISFDQAKEINKKSTQILAEVVDYFVQQKKKVIVVGLSYGAFIVQDLLATQGNRADAYLIMVGRLDMTAEVWQNFSQGNQVVFENGTDVIDFETYQKKYTEEDKLEVLEQESTPDPKMIIEQKNMAKIAAGQGYKRFSKRLLDTDLSNVVYVYGTQDEMVGALNPSEIEFLGDKDVELISFEGGHSETIKQLAKLSMNIIINRIKKYSEE